MSTPDIDPETGESTVQRSPRFTQWVAFLVFSIITMGSSVEVKQSLSAEEETRDAVWAVACSTITFIVSFVVVAMHMHPVGAMIVSGTKVEGGVLCVLVFFWAGVVAIVSDASNNLAVKQLAEGTECTNPVLNGNLYYFSWAGFVTAILLLVSYFRSVFGVDVVGEVKGRAARLTLWSALLATSLVVMGASANIYQIDCGGYDDTSLAQQGLSSYCKRCKYSISVGTIGTVFCLAVVGMKMATSAAPFVCEGVLSLLMAILDGFAVAYVTSAKGPGSAIGNLYYFTWLSFMCSIALVADCYNEYAGTPSSTAPEGDLEMKESDVPVENLTEEPM